MVIDCEHRAVGKLADSTVPSLGTDGRE